ncbi:MAG: lysoplasmalogenase [Clostridia bacterium]|nr:lysoplasmalogenase [Clostridia bacterium]
MKKAQKTMLAINGIVIATIFVLNFFYQSNGFDFTLKCICSGLFAFLGLVNLGYALKTKQENTKFYIGMSAGLVLAFLGDCLIGYDFTIGAATFALGHICFVVAYCFTQKMQKLDYAISGILFLGCLIFLLFCPLLTFEVALFRIVCIVYALIISTMLGKAIGNFVREKTLVNGTIAAASILFFFSDLMLVFDWFIGLWSWTDHACMGTYYPALCFLAFSMYIKAIEGNKRIFERNSSDGKISKNS